LCIVSNNATTVQPISSTVVFGGAIGAAVGFVALAGVVAFALSGSAAVGAATAGVSAAGEVGGAGGGALGGQAGQFARPNLFRPQPPGNYQSPSRANIYRGQRPAMNSPQSQPSVSCAFSYMKYSIFSLSIM